MNDLRNYKSSLCIPAAPMGFPFQANNNTSGSVGVILLNDLDNGRYSLRHPIPLVLSQEAEDEYVLTFPEAEISRSGETPGEALDWLKSSIVKLYETYRKHANLGPLPSRQLRTLEKFIVQKPNPKK